MSKHIEQINLKQLSLDAKIMFFEQLCTYTGASIAVSTALMNIEKYTPNHQIKLIAHILLYELDKGENFCDAILKFKKPIGAVYCNLLSLGAQLGELPRISKDIYIALKKQRSLISKIIQQCAYPAFLFFVIFLPCTGILLFFIIPNISYAYEQSSGQFPQLMLAIRTLTAMISNNWVFLSIILALIYFGFLKTIKQIFTTQAGLSIPLIGKFIKNYNLSLFTKLLAISYSAGIPITHGILLASESLPNKFIKDKLFKCSSMITRNPLTETFASTGLFEPHMITKIQTGELTGELDKLLYEISNNIDEIIETTVLSLVKILEPTLMIIMAVLTTIYAVTFFGVLY